MNCKRKVVNRRVDFYSVRYSEEYGSFPIGPNLLYEDELRFKYLIDGIEQEKIVPTTYFAQFLSSKPKKLIWYDELTRDKVYRGEFYTISLDPILLYK